MHQSLPVLFMAHSGPPLALDPEKGADYRRWSGSLPVPKAALIFSAHWETDRLVFGETVTHSHLIYDFGGFQPELYSMQYPAPGAPWLTEQIAGLFPEVELLIAADRGLDHGIWVPLIHFWPNADIPILQMTMPHNLSNSDLFELGARLMPLRQQGVMIVGSGNLTHNLRELVMYGDAAPPGWAVEFDVWVKETLAGRDYDALLNWEHRAPQPRRNHPTPEHFRPVLIAAGAAQHERITFPVEGFEFGSLSRRSVQFG